MSFKAGHDKKVGKTQLVNDELGRRKTDCGRALLRAALIAEKQAAIKKRNFLNDAPEL
jgi:hypothetical protein